MNLLHTVGCATQACGKLMFIITLIDGLNVWQLRQLCFMHMKGVICC